MTLLIKYSKYSNTFFSYDYFKIQKKIFFFSLTYAMFIMHARVVC